MRNIYIFYYIILSSIIHLWHHPRMFSSSVDFIISESALLILGNDLRCEAAKPLLETSTDRRSVTSTDDRGLYVTKVLR